MVLVGHSRVGVIPSCLRLAAVGSKKDKCRRPWSRLVILQPFSIATKLLLLLTSEDLILDGDNYRLLVSFQQDVDSPSPDVMFCFNKPALINAILRNRGKRRTIRRRFELRDDTEKLPKEHGALAVRSVGIQQADQNL